MTKVTVYSNFPTVELFANGVSLGVKEAADHFFYFDVPNVGTTHLVAKAGDLSDEGYINKVSEPNPDYILKEKGAVLNWWDITEVEGHCSLNSKLKLVIEAVGAEQAGVLLGMVMGVPMETRIVNMMDSMTVLRLIGLIAGASGLPITKEQLLALNAELNKIAIV